MTWRILTTLLIFNILAFANVSWALEGSNPTTQVDNGNFIPSKCTDLNTCTFDQIFGLDNETDSLFNRIINYAILTLAVPLTTIAIVYAGIVIVSNPASSSKREEGKRILYIAVWGLIITLSAYLIIKTIVNFLSSGNYPIELG